MKPANEKNSARKFFNLKSLGITFASIVVMASLFFIVYESMKNEVTVLADDEEITTKTMAHDVEELLDELELEVSEHDYLSADIEQELEDDMEIELNYATEVVVTIGDETKTYHTLADSIEEFFDEENIKVSEHDHYSFQLDDELSNGQHLAISKAFEVVINDAGEEETVMTTNQSVQSLLAQEDIDLAETDQLNIDPNENVKDQDTIEITRIDVERKTYDETVPYQTETENDDTLEKGKSRVVQEGTEGTKTQVFEITYRNGEEISRELIEEEVVEESQNHIVAKGTKEPPQPTTTPTTTASSDSNVQQTSSSGESSVKPADTKTEDGKTMTVRATAYSTNNPSLSTHTATGIDLRSNPKVIAVDPSVIPLGSKVWVEGYGTAIAGDTGGAIVGNKIDIHYTSYEKAKSFGTKTVRIKVY